MTPVAVPAQASRPASTPAAGRPAALPVTPSRAELTDAAFIVALTLIGIIGFRAAYGGTAYLIAGASGVVAGVALSHIGQRARVPLFGITAIGVLVFVLLGGLVSAGLGTGGTAIPTPATMHAVLLVAVSGWKQLLTTAQPVGSTGHLLALPYLLGIASGVSGHALARRTRAAALPAAPPAGVVALSILFGASHASAAAIQGAGLAALTLGWAAIRQHRGIARLTTVGRQRPWARVGAAAVVLAVAAGGAVFLGPRLPGAAAHQRVVLRAMPPSQAATYPSPLSGFRIYTRAVADPLLGLNGKLLLTTTGLPDNGQAGDPGDLIRIATMDFYDGTSWGVANAAAGESFAGFQSVGATLPGQEGAATGASAGPARTVTIAIAEAFRQPWLPSLPAATSLRFTGPDASAVRGALRYNVATGTGVVPVVPGGLRYTVTITAPPAAPRADKLWTATPAPGLTTTGFVMPSAVTSFAAAHAGGAITPMGKVRALASYLQSNGRLSDGSSDQAVLAGNGEGRLTAFLQSDLTGDDEQYAAAMALLADEVGVPARVTLDAAAEHDGSVYGKDVHANVELDLAQYGWVTLPLEDFRGDKKPVPQPKKTPQQAPAKAVPQQQPNAAPLTGNNQGSAASRGAPPQPKTSGFHLPRIVFTLLEYAGIPLAILIAIVAALRGAKAIRRRRRRSGPPVRQVAGAWAELVDLGRDLGVTPQPALTRREQALYIPGGRPPVDPRGRGETTLSPSSASLSAAVAVAADAAIFGAGDPSPAAVGNVWDLVAQARKSALAGLPRWRRAWVAINPASLWSSRSALSRRLALSRAGRAPAGPASPLREPERVGAMPGSLQ